jgi:cytochrome P450
MSTTEQATAATGQELPAFDPAKPETVADPYPVYRRYREADPVHWGVSALAGYPGAWYAFRQAEVAEVLKDPRFGKARRAPSEGEQTRPAPPIPEPARPYMTVAKQWIAHRDPPDHTRLKDILWPHFTPAAVARMRPTMTAIADHLIDGLEAGADLVDDYAATFPFHVIGGLLGIPREDWPLMVRWSAPMRAVGVRTTDETWQAASDAVTEFTGYLAELAGTRRAAPEDDLLSVLVQAREAGAFVTDEELVDNALFLVYAAAGLHTTTALITTGTDLLLRHPDQRALLAADPRLIGAAVNEFLRMEAPLQMTNRTAAAEVELGGRKVMPGDSVLAVLASANRDPEAFDDPDRLDIGRRRQPHHTFSAGIHTCFGGPMATVEGEVAIERLFQRLPDLAPAGPAEWSPAASLRQLRTLPVTF